MDNYPYLGYGKKVERVDKRKIMQTKDYVAVLGPYMKEIYDKAQPDSPCGCKASDNLEPSMRELSYEELIQFAKNWIDTAQQHARNEAYWRERALSAEGHGSNYDT